MGPNIIFWIFPNIRVIIFSIHYTCGDQIVHCIYRNSILCITNHRILSIYPDIVLCFYLHYPP